MPPANTIMVLQGQEPPLFSVIIPTFDRVELLKHALDSVFAQRFTDCEVIVVDDGSRDSTIEYLRTLEDRVKFLRQPNSGPGAARNRGACEARGKYLAFLDSDDLWFPWTLDVYAMAIVRAGCPTFLAGKPFPFASEAALLDIKEEAPEWQQFGDYLASGDRWRWWGVSSFLLRRQTFTEVGGFATDLKNGEDSDLALRIGTAHGFVQITAPFTFAYREHGGNIAGDLRCNVAALKRQIRAECSGEYPGGIRRRRERLQILTRHVRPLALACAKTNMRREAWRFYWSTLSWHIVLGRWRFISAF